VHLIKLGDMGHTAVLRVPGILTLFVPEILAA